MCNARNGCYEMTKKKKKLTFIQVFILHKWRVSTVEFLNLSFIFKTYSFIEYNFLNLAIYKNVMCEIVDRLYTFCASANNFVFNSS